MAKIKIIQDPGSLWPELTIDGIKLPYRSFKASFDPLHGIGNLEIDMLFKNGELDVSGTIKINGVPINDEIGRQFYESLKEKYENSPTERPL